MNGYPVNLLLQNRQCLVVGGGAVALRKATRLLEAGARVKVVAPVAVAGLRKLAAAGRLDLILSKCGKADLNDVFLVFFASDDHFFNKKMLEQAQSQRILSCAVDENWAAGDFITPASCRNSGLQLAIATGGQSCVRSKSVKNLLADQLQTLAAAVTLVTFTIDSEKSADKSLQDLSVAVAAALQLVVGVREFCLDFAVNRFEIAALLSNDKSVKRLLRLILADAAGGTGEKISERCGSDAFFHLCREFSQAKTPRAAIADGGAYARIGNGLQKLNSLLTELMGTETCKDDLEKKWREYADYCRKL